MKFAVWLGALGCLLAVVGCTPPQGEPPADPTEPTIYNFWTTDPVGSAPALATFAWSIAGPSGATLTCYLDGDGDGVDDIVISDCDSNDTRNFGFPAAGSFTARLTVTDGVSVVPAWRTLPLTVAAGESEPYNIEMRGLDSLDPIVRGAFTAAATRWEAALPVGIADTATIPLSCAARPELPLPTNIDDLFIDIEVKPIDGVGGTLGEAGPTCVKGGTQFSTVGLMRFDIDDVANMISNGSVGAVIEHEMGHVLGIGTLWNLTPSATVRKLIRDAGMLSTHYIGPKGVAEWKLLGGNGNLPLESGGGGGTADVHWSEAVFGTELMTGYIYPGVSPRSRMSIASLGDLGLHVNLGAADAYSLPSPAVMGRPGAPGLGLMLRPEISFTTETP